MKVIISIPLAVLTFIIASITQQAAAQSNHYTLLTSQYEQFLNDEQYDSSLIKARQIRTWVLDHNSCTKSEYAQSFRYIANSFSLLQQPDSAIYYFREELSFLNLNQEEVISVSL